MQDPREALQNDLKAAMRAKDSQRVTVIRMALNAIKQEEIDTRKDVSAQDATAILLREAKKRRESIGEAEQAGRSDIAAEETAELAILEAYLPQQMGEDELRTLVQAAIDETGATSPKEMGQVMKVLMPRLKGQADGKQVNAIVRELLSSN